MRLGKNHGYVGRPVLLVTEAGVEVRAVSVWEGGRIVDSEGTHYTKPVLRTADIPGVGRVFVALLELSALQRLEEMSREMESMAMHEILTIQGSGAKIVMWVLVGVGIVLAAINAFMLFGLRSAWGADLAEINATLQQLIALSSQPRQIGPGAP